MFISLVSTVAACILGALATPHLSHSTAVNTGSDTLPQNLTLTALVGKNGLSALE